MRDQPLNGDEPAVVVIGGGLAGWLAAIELRAVLPGAVPVRLVRAPSIPPIGVGESATGLLSGFLRRHSVDPADFVRGARATVKLGIEHVGWREPDHVYLGPIDNPDAMAGIPAAAGSAISQRAALADGCPLAAAHLHYWLMRRDRVPARAGEPAGAPPDWLGTHGWHFDAGRAAIFAEHIGRQRGVDLVEGRIGAVERRCDGRIGALRLADGRAVAVTFALDCSGFARLLMEESDWVRQDDRIKPDRAVAGFRPHRGRLPPATRAVAARCGWIWEIPTLDRVGLGYVHASGAIAPDEAMAILARHGGEGFEPGPTLAFEPGYRRTPWQANGVAIGLAAGFAEPLESTSLHLALVQSAWVAHRLAAAGVDHPDWSADAAAFNRWMADFQEDLADFIALHYVAGGPGGAFWREAAEGARNSRLYRVAFERGGIFPPDSAFAGRSRGLSANLVLPVAAGLGLVSPAAATVTAGQRRAARTARRLHREYCATALGHRAALAAISPDAPAGAAASATRKEMAHASIG